MSENNGRSSSDDTAWLMFIFVGIVMGLGWFYGEQLKSAYLTLKLIQLKFITVILPIDYYEKLIPVIENKAPSSWKMSQIITVGTRVGYVVNIPLIAIISWLSYKIYIGNPVNRFKRVMSMTTLKQSEQRLWPYIAPVVTKNVLKEPMLEGPYSMALKPYDYCVKYNLLTDVRSVGSLDRVKTEKRFIHQLGRLYNGLNKLKKHELALLCIFAAYALDDKKGMAAAVNELAIAASKIPDNKMPDFGPVIERLSKHLEHPDCKRVLKKHAYVNTLMAGMLTFARRTGVLPSSYFIWLKPRDRTLWYVINNIGRPVAFIEVGGIIGHFKAEQIANHSLETPLVSKAVDGVEKALSEIKLAALEE